MPQYTKFLCTAAFAAMFALPSFAETIDSDTVVATVGDTEITLAHVLDIRRKLPDEYQTLPDDVLFNGIVEQLVQQEMLAATVANDPAWVVYALENQRRTALANDVLNKVGAAAVTEQALQAAYAEQYGSDSGALEYNASHILVETQAKALELLAELASGADFAELAREHSTGPSGPNGGSLGWFGKGRMVPAFETAVIALEKDAVSPPVQTEFGWHVVKLNDTRSITPPPLDAVRGDLAMVLENAAIETMLTDLAQQVNVERNPSIDPSVVSTFSLDDVK